MKYTISLFTAISLSVAVYAQERDTLLFKQMQQNAKDIKELQSNVVKMGSGTVSFSGYAHFQWVYSPELREWPEGFISTYGDIFTPEMNNRLQVRRSRIKMTYRNGPVTAVIQPEFSEKNVHAKDIFVNILSNNEMYGLRMGLFDRPFGYEIAYTSPNREAAERSRTCNAVFPYYRDVGIQIQLKGPKGSVLNQFSLDAGIFNGNGISVETDKYKDFIGRLAWLKTFDNTELGVAYSLCSGTIYGGTMADKWHNSYEYRKGEGYRLLFTDKVHRKLYHGISAKVTHNWQIGRTLFVTEWLVGEQPSSQARFGSTIGSGFNGLPNIYLRNFVGGYVYWVQNIANTKHSVLFKYDYLDPNIRVSGNEIGKAIAAYFPATGADIAYTAFSIGYVYDFSHYLRFLVQYDFTNHEESANLPGYRPEDKFNENIFTFRIQIKYP